MYGGIPEWPKGADCKSVSCAFSGSNPLSPTLVYLLDKPLFNFISRGGAVWKLVGLITRRSQVQILSSQLKSTEKRLVLLFYKNAQIAQLVEQRTENPRVTGSIPVLGTFFMSGIHRTENPQEIS